MFQYCKRYIMNHLCGSDCLARRECCLYASSPRLQKSIRLTAPINISSMHVELRMHIVYFLYISVDQILVGNAVKYIQCSFLLCTNIHRSQGYREGQARQGSTI
jgi:hypothetical protein